MGGGRVGGPMDFTKGNKNSQIIKDSSEDLSDGVPKKKARARTSKPVATASEKKVRSVAGKTKKRSAPVTTESSSEQEVEMSPPKRKKKEVKKVQQKPAAAKSKRKAASSKSDSTSSPDAKPAAKATKKASRRVVKPPPVVLDSSADSEEMEEVIKPKPRKKKAEEMIISDSDESWKGSTEESEEIIVDDMDDIEIPETQDVDNDKDVNDLMTEDEENMNTDENEDEDLFSSAQEAEEEPATPSPKKAPLKELKTENILPPVKTENDDVPVTKRASPRLKEKKMKSSRYSMMPLHTEPVLVKTDILTGEMRGKHPVFIRSKNKNVQKADASTQVTPTLRRNRPKVKKAKK